jgi:hypothetical protein
MTLAGDPSLVMGSALNEGRHHLPRLCVLYARRDGQIKDVSPLRDPQIHSFSIGRFAYGESCAIHPVPTPQHLNPLRWRSASFEKSLNGCIKRALG